MKRFVKLSKSPGDLVKHTKELLDGLEGGSEKSEAASRTELSHTLRFVKQQLAEHEWEESARNQFCQEVYRTDLIIHMLRHHGQMEFEAKKDARQIFQFLVSVKRSGASQAGQTLPTVDYICSKPQILTLLCQEYLSGQGVSNSGPMLRDCLQHESLATIFLNSADFYRLFSHTEVANFDVAVDAFLTLRVALCKHKKVAAEFLEKNYETFFGVYEQMFKSENYATKRQFLKLLSDLLLDRSNFLIMQRYIANPHSLKLIMVLLKDKSPSIQFEAFHVFKIFVANPQKEVTVLEIMTRNKRRLLTMLENFLPERNDDEQFKEEKEYLIKQITAIPSDG